jgi:HlyD family secretion protein
MTTNLNPESNATRGDGSMRKFLPLVPLALIALIAYFTLGGSDEEGQVRGTTFEAMTGNLEITVVEGGSIEAKESQELKCEVQGQTKILSIVEEGYSVTPQDVAEGKVLVELDSKELVDRLTEQELQYQNALASFTEAREQYGIQINQNQSDVKAAELDSKFALMDLKKYLGEDIATDIAARVEESFEASQPPVAAGSEREDLPSTATEDETVMRDPETGKVQISSASQTEVDVDFSKYSKREALGDGEARQMLLKLEDDVDLAREDVNLAESKLEGTKRLFAKDFVTKIELDNDELTVKRKSINMDSAKTDIDLYVKYEFPKQAEKLLSDYEESLRALQRARRLAVSKLAQAEAKLNSAEARYELQTRKRDELKEQITKCVIPATQPGLVVYGEGNRSYYRNNDRIEEGASVRERQVLITIPDTTQMTVDVKVHESYVKLVKKGQRARITVDAFPDKLLEGEVLKIAVLPDTQSRWMNPDLKVYSTTILIDGQFDWLRPGMSAEGEIIIETLTDVVMVPLQAVAQEKGETVVYLANRGMERRAVETGSFNTTFIEIKSGLETGDVVALRAPASAGRGEDADASQGGGSDAGGSKGKRQGKGGKAA